MNLASLLHHKLRSTPAELSNVFKEIGCHVRDIEVKPEQEIDAALTIALKEMPELRAITITYDPKDTRRYPLFLDALRQLKQLEHITLAEPPCYQGAPGCPNRREVHQSTTQIGKAETEDSSSESGSDSGSERGGYGYRGGDRDSKAIDCTEGPE
jgi:hypothetical protein